MPYRNVSYYYLSSAGRRLFDLALGEATLAFLGAGSKPDIFRARQLIAKHGNGWPSEWLRIRGMDDWAEYIGKLSGRLEASGTALPGANRVPMLHTNGTAKEVEINRKGKRLVDLLSTILIAIAWLLCACVPAHALFGAGDIVFDPTMYSSQLQQLQQETQTVLTEAQQLQYMIKNTTGGYAGVWQSSASMSTN